MVSAAGVCKAYYPRSTGMRRLNILFVESDPNIQEKIQGILGDDFSVRCVKSVVEAKELLQALQPDILISEVVVDQESGLDLCRYVRGTPALSHLPIMLLTSLTTLQDKVAGFDAGADDYVVKPFDVHHLQARLRLLARIKRLERRIHA
jgi:DNA-binding response OmpR family regulator